MRTIQGTVLVKETGEGVAGVVVVAHDAKRRLGSAQTDPQGRFRINYPEDAAEKSWSVLVEVITDDADGPRVLYKDAKPRSAAGVVESYSIRIPGTKLTEASVHVAAGVGRAPLARGAVGLRELLDEDEADRVLAAHARSRIDADRARSTAVRERVLDELRLRGRTAAPPTGPVLAEQVGRLRRAITTRFATDRRRAVLPLTPADRERLVGSAAPGDTLDAEVVRRFLYGRAPAERTHVDLLASECRGHAPIHEACAPEHEVTGPAAPEPSVTSIDVAAQVARLLQPGSASATKERPDLRSVEASVQEMELRGGPADTDAIFDFQVMHLACDDVCRDLVDDDLVETAAVLEQEISRHGGEIDAGALEVSRLRREAHDLLRVVRLRDHRRRTPAQVRDHRAGTPPVRDHRTPATAGTEPDVVGDPLEQLEELLEDLERLLAEPYRFTVFGSDATGAAINFGLIVTYRQTWHPLGYQPGKLVRAVTLAPREERTYSTRVVTSSRRRTETKEKFRDVRRREDAETARATRDIVETAQRRTGFEASYTSEVGGASLTVPGADQMSSDTRQRFREAVVKAASEYEAERTVDVGFETGQEHTSEESGKLVNPNDELAVTYQFYELQRRFRVSERIHRVTPVILVAQPVPAPHEITIGWLIQHDWILRRVLLDPSFEPALRYISESLAGEEVTVGNLQRNVEQQRTVVQTLGDNLATARGDLEQRYAALERAIRDRGALIATEASEGFVDKVAELFGGDPDAEGIATSRLREQMARDAYERVLSREREVSDRLQQETSLLTAMTDRWIAAQRSYLDKTVEVRRLRLHVKQNILYYMQAIWAHEPPDQRYLRMRKTSVPRIEGTIDYELVDDPDGVPLPPTWSAPTVLSARLTATVSDETDPLVTLADLDRPLGYKANYAIFPLRTMHPVTAFMMAPFVDPASGVHDPDDLGNYTPSALEAHYCCLKERLSSEELAAIEPGIENAYRRLLAGPRPSEAVIVVPSDTLHIEQLPSSRPILEDFKLQHRAIDVARARAETTRIELDNLRRGARILAGDLEDPDIEKQTIVQGTAGVIVEDD